MTLSPAVTLSAPISFFVLGVVLATLVLSRFRHREFGEYKSISRTQLLATAYFLITSTFPPPTYPTRLCCSRYYSHFSGSDCAAAGRCLVSSAGLFRRGGLPSVCQALFQQEQASRDSTASQGA